jgi:hypothetical protein
MRIVTLMTIDSPFQELDYPCGITPMRVRDGRRPLSLAAVAELKFYGVAILAYGRDLSRTGSYASEWH